MNLIYLAQRLLTKKTGNDSFFFITLYGIYYTK